MNKDEVYDYASSLILDHATGIRPLSVYEGAEEHGLSELSEKDFEAVLGALDSAYIQVSWPGEHDTTYHFWAGEG